MKFIDLERTAVRDCGYDEYWVQDRIAENPAILGLGNFELRDRERRQPGAGRLDLLLDDPNTDTRYEVEIQLGRTDPSHIIRTLEYWDIERKRYPQYEHTAVIVAESITSRFLNVISLFNGAIPLIAIQMNAVKANDGIGLVFTTVLNQVSLGIAEEEDSTNEVTDRAYWESRANRKVLAMVDNMLNMIHVVDPGVQLNYNKSHIGLAREGRANNYVNFHPRKRALNVTFRTSRAQDLDEMIENSGLDLIRFHQHSNRYRLRVPEGEFENEKELLGEFVRRAYAEYGRG